MSSPNSSSNNSETTPQKPTREQRIFKSEEEIQTNYWFIIDGMVIDFSDFLWGHPGRFFSDQLLSQFVVVAFIIPFQYSHHHHCNSLKIIYNLHS